MNVRDKDMVVLYSNNNPQPGFLNYTGSGPGNVQVSYRKVTDMSPIILKVQYPVPSGRASITHFRLHADGFPDNVKRYLAPGSTTEPLIWTTKIPEPWALEKDQVLSYGSPQYFGYFRQGSWHKHLKFPLFFYSLEEFSQTYPDCQLPLCRPTDVDPAVEGRNARVVNILKNGFRQTRRISSMTWMIILGVGILLILLLFWLFFRSSSTAKDPPKTAPKTPAPEPAPKSPKSPKSPKVTRAELPLIPQGATNTSTTLPIATSVPAAATIPQPAKVRPRK